MSEIKNKGGRPRKYIDYDLLDRLCAIQCTGVECAEILGMSYESLDNKLEEDGKGGFLQYFKLKSLHGKASLRRRQYQVADDGNPTMLIFLGKQWLGQADSRTVDHKSSDGSMTPPTTIQIVPLGSDEDDSAD